MNFSILHSHSTKKRLYFGKYTTITMLLSIFMASPVSARDIFHYIKYFYNTNPTVLSAIENIQVQNEAYVQARDAFGPQISVSFEADYQQAKVDQTNFFGQKYVSNSIGRTATTSLDISQPIYSGGRLTAQVNGAQADVLAAREASRLTLGQSFKDAIQSYVDVLRDGAILTAAQHARDLLKNDLSDMQEKFKLGAATVSDRAEVLARLAAARAQVASAEEHLLESRATFLSVIGQEPEDLIPPTNLPALPATREASVVAALAESPTLKQAIYEEASARAKVALAKSAFSPDVSVRLGAQSQPVEQYESTLQNNAITAGLVVQVPLFNSGVSRSKLRQAEAQDRVALLAIEAARRSVVEAAEHGFAAYEAANNTVRLLSEQVQADRVAYESLDEQFRSGLISTIDLLNSEQEMVNAEISLATAEHDGSMAQADLLAATGRLEADILIPDAEPHNPETDFRKIRILASGFPTAIVARKLDGLAPIEGDRVQGVPAQPLEAPPPPDARPSPLDDIDPASLSTAIPAKQGPR